VSLIKSILYQLVGGTAMLVEAYYCTFVGYATYLIYSSTKKLELLFISLLLEAPVMGRVFGVW
jgi:hypothetical protein